MNPEQNRTDFILWKNTKFTQRGDGKILRLYEKRLTKKLLTLWAKQKNYILANLKEVMPETNAIQLSLDDILEDMPEKETIAKTIHDSMKLSLIRGGRSSLRKLKLKEYGISFSVDNLEAKKFLNRKLSHELSNYRGNIHKTTTDKIRKIIQESIDKGRSSGATAELISQQGEAGVFSLARGELISITETGRAYGKGARIPIDDFRLTNPTRPVLKLWTTAGDGNVRETHTANASQGWILYDQEHTGTGEKFAPSQDFRCRCVEQYDIPPPK